MIALEAAGVQASYGLTQILWDMSFTVAKGQLVALIGANGAGKTTTMRILAGESEPYAGTIVRTGEVGYLPQDPREGDLDILARDRVLSARGLDVSELGDELMTSADDVFWFPNMVGPVYPGSALSASNWRSS